MILVFSTEDDISTDWFMEWCNHTNTEVLRINENENVNLAEEISIDNGLSIKFNIKKCSLPLDEISAVWFRRGAIRHVAPAEFVDFEKINNPYGIRKYFRNESNTLDEFLVHILKEKKSPNHPYAYNSNKLIALKVAMDEGLNIPQTLITRRINSTKNYFGEAKVITKAVQDAINIEINNLHFSPSVHSISFSDLTVPPKFYYSTFQALIEAKYELRIFFIGEKYFACAQFGSSNKLKKHQNKTGRTIPYTLPEAILNRLKCFNHRLGYKSGSIDMLVDNNDKHYFLEINPVGQYDHVSKLCNYNLDYEILKFFIDE